MTLVLGLDLGSTTTKAVLADVSEGVVVVHAARRPTPTGVDALIDTAAAVMRESSASVSGRIAAVGIAAMGESGAPIERSGRALTPLLRWDRPLDRAHLDRLLACHPGLSAATGIPATTKPAAVVLTALRAERPDVFAAMRWWVGAADLVAHALTGVRATDHTLAARTMMASGDGDAWDPDVLAGLGLSSNAMPAVRPPGEQVALTTDAAAAFGLTSGVPVHIAGHDHVVGAWAAGVRLAGSVADSLGTSEAIIRVADAADAASAVAAGFAVGRTVDGTARTILGGSPACGALLARWETEHPDDRVTARLQRMAPDSWEAAQTLVLPYPSGRQCPAPDPAARLRVISGADAADRARGLLQSLVCHARWMRATADDLAGSPTTGVTVLGSLAERIAVWAPLTAAAGVPTWLCATAEPVATGAALLAGVRTGVASPDLALESHRVQPLHTAQFDDAYRRFLAAALEASSELEPPREGQS